MILIIVCFLFVQSEGEVQALTRRIRLLEEDFEQTEQRLQSASEKLEEASKAADESERSVQMSIWFLSWRQKNGTAQLEFEASIMPRY